MPTASGINTAFGIRMKLPPGILADYRFWAVALVLAMLVSSLLSRLRRLSERTFVCSRCHKTEEHNPRTIQAWRAGKRKFFCRSCHEIWLRTKKEEIGARSRGCLPILVVGLLTVGAIAYTILKA
jgi:hypothetical protein